MKEPQRLMDDPELSDSVRDLLEAGDAAPSPSPAARRRMGAAVAGIAAGGGIGALLSTKVLAAVLFVGAGGAATWAVVDSANDGETPNPQAPTHIAPRESQATPPPVPAEPEPVVEPEEPEEEAHSSPTRRRPRRRVEEGPPQEAAPALVETEELDADALAAEVRQLSRARSLLASDAQGALAAAQEARRLFPRGQMRDERELIAIDALLRLGRRGDAERRADRLVARNPNGLYARRARRLIDQR